MSRINACSTLHHQVRAVVIEFKVQVDFCTLDSGSNVKLTFIPTLANPAVVLTLHFVKQSARCSRIFNDFLLALDYLFSRTFY
jgi:hypothetical protein